LLHKLDLLRNQTKYSSQAQQSKRKAREKAYPMIRSRSATEEKLHKWLTNYKKSSSGARILESLLIGGPDLDGALKHHHRNVLGNLLDQRKRQNNLEGMSAPEDSSNRMTHLLAAPAEGKVRLRQIEAAASHADRG
jgi:hypothetical protein